MGPFERCGRPLRFLSARKVAPSTLVLLKRKGWEARRAWVDLRPKGRHVTEIKVLTPDLSGEGLGDGNETSHIFVVALSL